MTNQLFAFKRLKTIIYASKIIAAITAMRDHLYVLDPDYYMSCAGSVFDG